MVKFSWHSFKCKEVSNGLATKLEGQERSGRMEPIPKDIQDMSYEEIQEWVQHHVTWDAPILKAKMKFKYDQDVGWNQVYNNLDMFKDYQFVKNVCKDDLFCWLDSYHYSIMSRNDVTDFLYRYANHTSKVVGDSVVREIHNFKFTPDEHLISLFHKFIEHGEVIFDFVGGFI